MKTGVAIYGEGRQSVAAIGVLKALRELAVPLYCVLGVNDTILPIAAAMRRQTKSADRACWKGWRHFFIQRKIWRAEREIGRYQKVAAGIWDDEPGQRPQIAALIKTVQGEQALAFAEGTVHPTVKITLCQSEGDFLQKAVCRLQRRVPAAFSAWPLTTLGAQRTVGIVLTSQTDRRQYTVGTDRTITVPLPPYINDEQTISAAWERLIENPMTVYNVFLF